MTKGMIHIAVVALAWCAVSACNNSQDMVAPAPSWVTQSPVVPGHYVGIGSASTLVYPLDADAVAKANALDNLSREIRVQVQSTSSMNTLQVNDWLSESFQQQSTSSTNEDLEGFELVDTYSDGQTVSAYYRLNKAEHARIQAIKRQEAMNVAAGHLDKAIAARTAGTPKTAVDFAVRGLDALRPFSGQSLIDERTVPPVNLPLELLGTIDACVAGLALEPDVNVLALDVANAYRGQVQVKAMLDGLPAPNVPLTYQYNRGTIPTRGSVVTDNLGQATVVVDKIEPGNDQFTLQVNVDAKAFFEGLPVMHPMRAASASLQAPPLRISCELAPIRLHLTVEERAFGKTRNRPFLLPALQEALQQSNVVLVTEQDVQPGDLSMLVQADARPGGSGQGFFTMYVDVVGTVKNDQGDVLFTRTETGIKGVQGDVERATDVAYSKAVDQMQTTFVPDLVKVWHGF